MWLLFPVTLCVSTPGKPVCSGRKLGIKGCGTGSAPGYRKKTEGSCTRLFLGSHVQWLWAGPSWPRNLRRSGVLTCVLRCVNSSLQADLGYGDLCSMYVNPPGRPALSGKDLGMEWCGTGSPPGRDGNQKNLVPGCSISHACGLARLI